MATNVLRYRANTVCAIRKASLTHEMEEAA
jgi:hypothetical protein